MQTTSLSPSAELRWRFVHFPYDAEPTPSFPAPVRRPPGAMRTAWPRPTLRVPMSGPSPDRLPHEDVVGAIDPDRAALLRMRSGDESALGSLYDRWAPQVRALARRIVGDADSAEEVVEDAFWQAWRNADRFDAGRGDVGAWLLTIARSRALDRVRSERRRIPSARDDAAIALIPSPADTVATLVAAERALRVRAALAELPPEQREVLDLAYFGGLSQTEIAERTQTQLGTVKGRIRLAMEKLRGRLRGLHEEDR